MITKRVIAIIIAILLIGSSIAQTTVSLSPSDDTELNQVFSSPRGGLTGFLIKPWVPSWSSRATIRFDLSAYSGCTINSAWLVLYEKTTYGQSKTINVHRLTTDWSESTATWTVPWTTSGGDYSGTVEGSFTPVWTGTYKQDSVNLTTSVQDFVDGTYSNFGWLLKIATEDASQKYWEYCSKEYATSANRPILRITYSVLPIELLSFSARQENENVRINWSTASETNNDFFTIERSIDAQNFEILKTFAGAGNSNEIINYSEIDEFPLIGISYYRLKQTDFNGDYSYSEIVAVENLTDNLNLKILNAYSNPNSINFTVLNPNLEDLSFEVFNILGEVLISTKVDYVIEKSKVVVSAEGLSHGIYFIKLSGDKETIVEKVLF
ncbi:MAG: DNRLRE domain-containing protein [Bacteroidetes bacterium]|nr:DNRLRE domain-containing protein [Bacteroidota bacterium]